MNNEINEIKEYINKNLYTKTGNLNSAIIRRGRFLDSNEWKTILSLTKFLDDKQLYDPIESERIYCILNDINEIQRCKVCGKEVYFKRNKPCQYSPTCSTICSRQIKTNWGSCSEGQKKNNQNVLTDFKNKIETVEGVENYEFVNMLLENSKNSKCVTNINLKNNYNELIWILEKTKHILPIEEISKIADFNFSQRCHFIKNNLNEIPKCVICGNVTEFRNSVFGYSNTCGNNICTSNIAGKIRANNGFFDKIKPYIESCGFLFIDNLNDFKKINDAYFKLKCNKCHQTHEYDISSGGWQDIYCRGCYGEPSSSFGEKNIVEYVKSIYSGEVFERKRIFKNNYKEVDIFIPEKNLAIEYNGLYWHSFGKNDKIIMNKHSFKTDQCEKMGIKLLHIFENEWKNSKSIWKSIISNGLEIYKHNILERDLEISVVTHETFKEFCIENCLNYVERNCQFYYGLTYLEKIVSVMSFSIIPTTKNSWKVSTFCDKKHFNVQRSFYLLLNNFIKNNFPNNIIIEFDRRWNRVCQYEKQFEFFETYNTNENTHWVKGDYFVLSDMSDIESLLGESYNCQLSDSENMFNNNFRKLYDCGNLVFHWKRS